MTSDGRNHNDQQQGSPADNRNQQPSGPQAARMKTGEEGETNSGDKPASGSLAANPKLKHEDMAPADATPSEKNEPSAIPGAEAEGNIGNAQAGAGFAGGTKGAGTSSEGRKGDPANYGSNQAGAGMATGPIGNNND